MPPERSGEGEFQPAEQLARPPPLAALGSGYWEFQVCTTHIVWAGSARGGDAVSKRLREVRNLGQYLRARARQDQIDLLLMGDFQLERPGGPLHQALLEGGVQLPEAVLLPAHIVPDRYYSLIGFVSAEHEMPLADGDPPAGVVQIYEHVLRDEDLSRFVRTAAYRAAAQSKAGRRKPAERLRDPQRWRTYQMSDHLPLWVELGLSGTTDSYMACPQAAR